MRITVCIPAYQATRFIDRALESVRKQTYEEWEVVVVEDGSADPVESQVQRFAASVSQSVRYIALDRNYGVSAARNTALAAATGEFIALLDADDYWSDRHLEQLVICQQQSGADLVYSGSLLFEDESGGVTGRRRPSETDLAHFPLSLYRGGFIIQPSSAMILRSRLVEIGGSDEKFQHCEDLELWFRASKLGLRFAFSGDDTCFYRKHAGAISMNFPEMAKAAARTYCKHYDWPAISIDERKQRTAAALLAAGRLAWHRQPGIAFGWVLGSLQVEPTFFAAFYLAATVLAAGARRQALQWLPAAVLARPATPAPPSTNRVRHTVDERGRGRV